MDNIGKVSRIDTKLGDSSYRQGAYNKRLERAKAEIERSFSDIYDIRRLSAEFNRSSAEFRLEGAEEAGAKLENVIKSLDNEKTENVVETFPSEDVIELSKMIKTKK